jgi:hypothetical protein
MEAHPTLWQQIPQEIITPFRTAGSTGVLGYEWEFVGACSQELFCPAETIPYGRLPRMAIAGMLENTGCE